MGKIDFNRFKKVDGYGKKINYYIDKNGHLINEYGKKLKTYISNTGYECIVLRDERGVCRNVSIHRLIAKAYIPNPNNYPCVNHKDENKLNNTINNLEWCDYYFNNTFNNVRVKAAANKKIPVICIELNKTFDSISAAGYELNIKPNHISSVCKGKRNTTGGYHWKYVENNHKI